MKQQTRMRMYPCTATMLLTFLYEAWAFVGRKMPAKAVADWEHLFCRLRSWWEMMRQTELSGLLGWSLKSMVGAL